MGKSFVSMYTPRSPDALGPPHDLDALGIEPSAASPRRTDEDLVDDDQPRPATVTLATVTRLAEAVYRDARDAEVRRILSTPSPFLHYLTRRLPLGPRQLPADVHLRELGEAGVVDSGLTRRMIDAHFEDRRVERGLDDEL